MISDLLMSGYLYLQLQGVHVHGVVGRVANLLNGTYYPVSDKLYSILKKKFGIKSRHDDFNGSDIQRRQVFCRTVLDSLNKSKRIWLEYLPELKRWQFKPESSLQTDSCYAYIESKEGNLVLANSTKSVDIWTGKGPESWWEDMLRVKIIQDTQYIANKAARGISVAGFTGQYKLKLNGFYIPVSESSGTKRNSDGRTNDYDTDSEEIENAEVCRYMKADATCDCWLEYNYEYHAWQFKPTKSLNSINCWAYIETHDISTQTFINPWELAKMMSSDEGNPDMSRLDTFRRRSLSSNANMYDNQLFPTGRKDVELNAIQAVTHNETWMPMVPEKFKWYAINGFKKQTVMISSHRRDK